MQVGVTQTRTIEENMKKEKTSKERLAMLMLQTIHGHVTDWLDASSNGFEVRFNPHESRFHKNRCANYTLYDDNSRVTNVFVELQDNNFRIGTTLHPSREKSEIICRYDSPNVIVNVAKIILRTYIMEIKEKNDNRRFSVQRAQDALKKGEVQTERLESCLEWVDETQSTEEKE